MPMAALIGFAVLAVLVLVAVAYLLGRGIWRVAQPGDPDPGGRAVSQADVYRDLFMRTPFVELLRLYQRLRKRSRARSRQHE